MTAVTLTRPADVGLMAPGHDPRPCVNKPPQWWDLGNEHNPRAIRYCRNVCPLRQECDANITDETKPKGQIRAGHPYNQYGKQLTVCPKCDHPRTRIGTAGPPVCGCMPKEARDVIARQAAAREAARETRQAQKLPGRGQTGEPIAARRPRDELVDLWLPLGQQGLGIKKAAEKLGIRHNTLKSALHRARSNGDTRVRPLRALRTGRAAA